MDARNKNGLRTNEIVFTVWGKQRVLLQVNKENVFNNNNNSNKAF